MILELNSENFEQTISQNDKPVLVDFWAPWCGPCKIIGPRLSQISEEIGDDAIIAKVNVDENQSLASNFQIRNIPTLLYFKGGEVAFKTVGILEKDEIKRKIQSLY
jgi:thioredoxin 1